MENMIDVLFVQPDKEPGMIEIQNTLEAFQVIIDGYIEVIQFNDGAALICNEEGKLRGLPWNRVVREINDVIVGDFIVCGVAEDGDFCSLDQELVKKYTERFALH